MRSPESTPRKIAIGYHPSAAGAADLGISIVEWLKTENGVTAVASSMDNEEFHRLVKVEGFDAFIAIGGDGTMLRAGRLCGPVELPILGINLGHFGFLTEVRRDEWRTSIRLMLEGKYWLEDRMMLTAEHWQGGQAVDSWDVLNEVVVTRGQFVRPITIMAFVDDNLLNTYTADGLIVSTPTGSTAYALAAGGPIMPPELRNILMIAVAPHLLFDRALILAEGSVVKINVMEGQEAVFSVDGHLPVTLQENDQVRVCASENRASFIRFQDPGYFYRNLTRFFERTPYPKRISNERK